MYNFSWIWKSGNVPNLCNFNYFSAFIFSFIHTLFNSRYHTAYVGHLSHPYTHGRRSVFSHVFFYFWWMLYILSWADYFGIGIKNISKNIKLNSMNSDASSSQHFSSTRIRLLQVLDFFITPQINVSAPFYACLCMSYTTFVLLLSCFSDLLVILLIDTLPNLSSICVNSVYPDIPVQFLFYVQTSFFFVIYLI